MTAIGVPLIQQERIRQIYSEGFDADHDAAHTHAELLEAALAYVACAIGQVQGEPLTDAAEVAGLSWWPVGWSQEWWKPSNDPIRNLTKAGALIAAEIDRLDHARTLARSSYDD